MTARNSIASLWTATGFVGADLSAYAERLVAVETRQGVIMMSVVSLLLLGGAAIIYGVRGMGDQYVYTYSALAALSLHILLSAKSTSDIRVLYLLGTVLLVIIGVGLVLLAHRAGSFSGTLFTAVALLFMVVPMVPWGLRDAAIVTLLIYGLFTASTLAVWGRFSAETLWTLQYLMLSAGVVSLMLVMRAVSVRKHHIEARFALERNERELKRLSERDPLTGAYNRRALETGLPALLLEALALSEQVCFAVLDLDHFKRYNDAHGHQCGDTLLRTLAKCLTEALAPGELLVRMGGDEFAVVMKGEGAPHRLERAASAFQSAAAEPDGASAPACTLSIGYTRIAPESGVTLSHAYSEADAALYRAKRAGRSRIWEFRAEERASPAAGAQRVASMTR